MNDPAEPRHIGSRLELFVDDWLIDSMTNARLKLHEPTPKDVVFEFNQPYEWERSEPWGLLVDQGLYRLYYRTRKIGSRYTCAYAESDDGIHWRRPSLGLHEIDGSRDNNVVLADEWMEDATLTAFADPNPDVPADERYKAFARYRAKIDAKGETLGLLAMASADAVRWRRLVPEPVASVIRPGGQAFDSANIPFWDANRGEYADMFKAGIIDPVKVVRTALRNAASIAALLLTTEALVTSLDKEDKNRQQVEGSIR